jgi:F0F1-type ATP synthase membrane subunit b/b'
MTTIIRAIVGAFVAEIFEAIDSYLRRIRGEQAAADKARADLTAKINKETADAERRAAEAAINAPDGSQLDDDLASGRVHF